MQIRVKQNLYLLLLTTALMSLTLQGDTLSSYTPTKYICTGGPGAGKTSTLLYLEAFEQESFVPESAADVQLVKRAQGKEQPWLDEDLNYKVLALQLQRENNITPNPKNRIFLDRCPIDVLVYEPKDTPLYPTLLKEAKRISNDPSYSKTVFLFENLGHCQKNLYRYEDIEHALKLEREQERNYKQFGFNVVRIPATTIEERAAMILNTLDKGHCNKTSISESISL